MFNLSNWEVVKDDGDTIVLKRQPDGDGCGCVVIIILIIVLNKFFGEPSSGDLSQEKYLEKAESFVEDYVIDWQKRNWEGWGWQPRSITNFSEPEYKVEIADWKSNEYKSLSNRVEYLGQGFYKVIVVTDTHLRSKRGDSGIIRETFIFQIKRESGDKYKVLNAEKTWMYPSQEKFNEMLKKWSNS